MQDLILLLSRHPNLPVVFVFGVATSLATLHTSLSQVWLGFVKSHLFYWVSNFAGCNLPPDFPHFWIATSHQLPGQGFLLLFFFLRKFLIFFAWTRWWRGCWSTPPSPSSLTTRCYSFSQLCVFEFVSIFVCVFLIVIALQAWLQGVPVFFLSPVLSTFIHFHPLWSV